MMNWRYTKVSLGEYLIVCLLVVSKTVTTTTDSKEAKEGRQQTCGAERGG